MSPDPDHEPVAGADSGGTELDCAFDALSHRYRRRLLFALSTRQSGLAGAVAVSDLVADGRDGPRGTGDLVLGKRPVPAPIGAADDRDSTAVRTELVHVHLPKLADAGYVRWDPDGETVRRGPSFGAVEPIVRLLLDHWDELPTS
jgi:hypothetical protein